MITLKLTLEYDGTGFSGWQTQPKKRTVQSTLEEAFERLLGDKMPVVGASRTDAGVHAMGQVAHIQISKTDLKKFKDLRYSLNSVLPDDISVLKIESAPKGFHAIRSAKKKIYVYQIWNSPVKPALDRRTVWPIWEKLDLVAIRRASKHLVGRHDFSAFEGAQAGAVTKIRTLYKITIFDGSCRDRGGRVARTVVSRQTTDICVGGGLSGNTSVTGPANSIVFIEFCGNGFLKYMVRNIVGTLVEVGRGRRKASELADILKSKDRRRAGQTAPAQGLFLKKVVYDS